MDGYVNFLAAELYAEISGMNAENMYRQSLGYSVAYTEDSFIHVKNEYRDKLEQYQKMNSRKSC